MRAIERAQAIKDMTSSEWNRGKGGKLDKVKGQQKLVIDKEPEYIYNREGDVVGVDAWVRLFDGSGKEVKIDPHRRIVNPPTVPRSGIVETDTGKKDSRGRPIKSRELTSNPSEAFYEAVWDSVVGTPNAKGWRTKGTVTTIFGSGTSYIASDASSYSDARSGTGLGGPYNGITVGQIGFDPGDASFVYNCEQSAVSFDTSAIDDDNEVSSVVMSLYHVTSDAGSYTIEAREKDWGASYTTADWVAGASLGGLTLMASQSIGNITAGYNAFESEAAILSATNLKTGTIYFILCSSKQRTNNAPSGFEQSNWQDSNASGTSQDPKLDVTHASPFTPSNPVMMNRPMRVWRLY